MSHLVHLFFAVAWWQGNVRGAGQPKKELTENAVNSLPAAQATEITGMTQQRVSALKTQLGNPEAYPLRSARWLRSALWESRSACFV